MLSWIHFPDVTFWLPAVWFVVVLTLGLIQVPLGTLLHKSQAPKTRWRRCLWVSLTDCHLFIFSIGTSGGIIGTVASAMLMRAYGAQAANGVPPVAGAHATSGAQVTVAISGGPGPIGRQLCAMIIAVLIIAFSSALWTMVNAAKTGGQTAGIGAAIGEGNTQVLDLDARTISEPSAPHDWAIGFSIVFAIITLLVGLLAEASK